MLKLLRWIIGRIILLFNFIFSPKSTNHSSEVQNNIDANSKAFALYQLNACPFCVKVRRAAKRLNIPLQTIDIKEEKNLQKLVNEGGKRTVPCLFINEENDNTWLYESKDIVAYLENWVKNQEVNA